MLVSRPEMLPCSVACLLGGWQKNPNPKLIFVFEHMEDPEIRGTVFSQDDAFAPSGCEIGCGIWCLSSATSETEAPQISGPYS